MLETAGRSVPWSAIFVCLLATLGKPLYLYIKYKGTIIRHRRGGGVWSFLFTSQGRFKALFISPQDRLEIFISIFILYLFIGLHYHGLVN